MTENIIVVERDGISEDLKLTAELCRKKSPIPNVTENAYLLFDEDGYRVTTTDTVTTLTATGDGVSGETAVICCNGSKLAEIINLLEGSVCFSFGKNEVVVFSGKTTYKLRCRDPEDFPALTKPEDFDVELTLNADLVETALNRTQFAIARGFWRKELECLLLHMKDGELRFVASDGYRLAEYRIPCKTETERKALILGESIPVLRKVLTKSDSDEVTIRLSEKFVDFRAGRYEVLATLYDGGGFPGYETVIDEYLEKLKTRCITDGEAFMSALRRVAAAGGGSPVRLTFDFRNGCIRFYSRDEEGTAEAEDRIEVTYYNDLPAEPVSAFYNPAYLKEGIKDLGTEFKIRVPVSDTSPVIVEKGEYLYILMPVKED